MVALQRRQHRPRPHFARRKERLFVAVAEDASLRWAFQSAPPAVFSSSPCRLLQQQPPPSFDTFPSRRMGCARRVSVASEAQVWRGPASSTGLVSLERTEGQRPADVSSPARLRENPLSTAQKGGRQNFPSLHSPAAALASRPFADSSNSSPEASSTPSPTSAATESEAELSSPRLRDSCAASSLAGDEDPALERRFVDECADSPASEASTTAPAHAAETPRGGRGQAGGGGKAENAGSPASEAQGSSAARRENRRLNCLPSRGSVASGRAFLGARGKDWTGGVSPSTKDNPSGEQRLRSQLKTNGRLTSRLPHCKISEALFGRGANEEAARGEAPSGHAVMQLKASSGGCLESLPEVGALCSPGSVSLSLSGRSVLRETKARALEGGGSSPWPSLQNISSPVRHSGTGAASLASRAPAAPPPPFPITPPHAKPVFLREDRSSGALSKDSSVASNGACVRGLAPLPAETSADASSAVASLGRLRIECASGPLGLEARLQCRVKGELV